MSQWLGWLGCLMFGHTWAFRVMIGNRTYRECLHCGCRKEIKSEGE